MHTHPNHATSTAQHPIASQTLLKALFALHTYAARPLGVSAKAVFTTNNEHIKNVGTWLTLSSAHVYCSPNPRLPCPSSDKWTENSMHVELHPLTQLSFNKKLETTKVTNQGSVEIDASMVSPPSALPCRAYFSCIPALHPRSEYSISV